MHHSIIATTKEHLEISSKRSRRRCAARNRKIEKRRTRPAIVADNIQKLEAAHAAVRDHTATPAQQTLVRKAERAAHFADCARNEQSPEDRIWGAGYRWHGGLVAGKYFQKARTYRGLKSWEHPLLLYFLRATPKASSGRFFAGRAKDRCHAQARKIHGADQPYFAFGQRCKDMFRIELDLSFKTVADFKSAIFNADLRFLPHVASWIFDDRLPGAVLRPHLFYILPDGHGVWSNAYQHRLLRAVIAGLTKTLLPLGADPGGLANPFHGKNPVSPHCDYAILQDTHMPTLSEYAEGLDVSMNPQQMARNLACEKLERLGFNPRESNTFFSWASKAAWLAAVELYKSGALVNDRMLFANKIAEAVMVAAQQLSDAPNATGRAALIKTIETCARWVAEKFDPAKLDKSGKDRGGAAHLMAQGDNATTRMRKGQVHAAEVRITETRLLITEAIMAVMMEGRNPEQSQAEISARSKRSMKTVKRHFFACFTAAVASLRLQATRSGIQVLVKGVPLLCPPLSILQMANHWSDLPKVWREPAFRIDWRDKRIRAARSIRQSNRRRPHLTSASVPGRNTLDLLSGIVKRFVPSARQSEDRESGCRASSSLSARDVAEGKDRLFRVGVMDAVNEGQKWAEGS